MEYLKNFIGRVITVDLTDEARKDRMMKLFYETGTHDDFIGNKLLGVDNIGIWLEGFKTVTRLLDKDGKDIPKAERESENVTVSVFINYGYIRGIAIINDPSINAKMIGFKEN